jgi:hypothetical protein
MMKIFISFLDWEKEENIILLLRGDRTPKKRMREEERDEEENNNKKCQARLTIATSNSCGKSIVNNQCIQVLSFFLCESYPGI